MSNAMDANTVMALQHQHVLGTYPPADLMLVRGQGSRVWDSQGKCYLDFCLGISVCNLGHCHPRVTAAIREQAGKLVHVSNLFYNENQPRLAALIASHSFGGRVFFCNSGAEANEGLIKFARKWGHEQGRYEILCMVDSFHGRTLATLAATGREKYRKGFGPDMPGFRFVPFNDLDALAQAIAPETVAVLLEPVQGEGGVIAAQPDYLKGVRALCDCRSLLLLCDEVQCGMGRTGTCFAYQQYGIEPDGMSMAKALGNGVPIGAFEVQSKYDQVLTPGTHASTFGGTPLACAAGIAVFEAFAQDGVLDNCRQMAVQFREQLTRLQAKHRSMRAVRGLGLMIGVDLAIPVKDVVRQCRDSGLLVLSAGETVLRILPPLTVTAAELAEAVGILDAALGASTPAS
jgi:predicted acetylornithine/succinylornithine family transaminase